MSNPSSADSASPKTLARALVVDDEQPARARLIRMLREGLSDRIEVVGEANDGVSALAMLAEHEPDLLFLDVQMPQMDGLELVARMPHPQPYVIFTTAHDRYALDAFDAGAIDYLLKPFDQSRLLKAVSRAEARGMGERAGELLAPLIAKVREARPLSDRLPVTVSGRVLLVPVQDISHCTVEHELVVVYTRTQSYTTDYTLASLESRLDASRFFRAHRALLVNLDHVGAIDDLPGGRALLLTDTGLKLVVSRQASRKLRALLGV
ncbi:MAG: response regulator [Deltaproteobacteria bacterium]|nr:response regulator [Deltaproteobacteria bacterium]